VSRRRRREPRRSARSPIATAPRAPGSAPAWRRTFCALAVLAAAVLPYLNALDGALLSDAALMIGENPALRGSTEWLAWFGRDFYWGSPMGDPTLYRPLTVWSFLVHLRTTGLTPGPFLLGNVLLHAAASLLVLALGDRLVARPAGLLGALLFAVHPIHTEAVAWVMGRSELLAAVFALGACLLGLRARDCDARRPWAAAGGAVAAYAAALGAKEHVALLPLWFGLTWLVERPRRAGRVTAAMGVASLFVLAGFLALRAHALVREDGRPALGLFNPAADVPAPRRWLTALAVIARYAGLLVWPGPLSHDHGFAETVASTGLGLQEAVGLAVVVGLAAVTGLAARWQPGLALALALVPVSFVLVSNLPFPIGTVMAERLLYLPSAGLALAAGWLLARLPLPAWLTLGARAPATPPSPAWRPIAAASLVVLAVTALAARTVIRNADWRSKERLVAATRAASPRAAWAAFLAALLERDRGADARAIALAEESLRIYPRNHDALAVLGDLHARQGRLHDAIRRYEEGLAIFPRSAPLHDTLGWALGQTGRWAEAERELRESARLDPGLLSPRLRLGGLLLRTGRPDEALAAYREAARIAPRDPLPRWGMAGAAFATGDLAAAAVHARQAALAGYPVPEAFWRSLGIRP